MALTKAQLIDLNANELILDLDADTSLTADTDDQIDIKIGGADDFTFTANAFNVLTGSHATFADSANAKFGTGSDMLVYHDGSNSYITNAVGALKVATETSGIAITLGHSTSEVTVADNLTVSGTLGVTGVATFSAVPVFPNDTVETADIQDNAVTLAKMAGIARGKIIYGDSSGNPAVLAVGSSGQSLTSDGTDISWGSGGAISTYSNSTNNRVITSVDSSSVNAEANLTFDGTTLAVTGTVEPSGDTASGDNAAIGYTSTEGLILTGQGSTNDVTIKNDADETVLSIPTGTTNVTVAGNLTASANETYDLGTSSLRWRDIYLSGNTIDLNGATISADGTGTISISASGASLPAGSKIGGRPLQTTAADGVPERNVSFFTAVGGLVTAATTLIFKADVERKFTAFTLANGSSIGNPIQIFSF